MRRKTMLVSAVVGLTLAACGGNDNTSGDGSSADALLDCGADAMHLKGEIEGTSIDRIEAIDGSGLTQVGSGHFDSMYVGRDWITDPERSWLVLDWANGIPDGARSSASGTLVLPASEPRGGETLCAGSGTFVGFSRDGMFYFGLRGFATGDACDTPVSGSLDGCWNNVP